MFTEGKHYAVTDDGCWLWLRGRSSNGYGLVKINNKTYSAHRISYEDAYGPITEGMYVLHSCDVRLCVNPEHLREGTQSENLQDANDRFRLRHQCTEDDIAFIIYYRQQGYTYDKIADLTGLSDVTIGRIVRSQLHNN